MATIYELSPAKRALLELRLKKQSHLSRPDPIPRRDPGKPAPLSFTQELLWLQQQITPGPAYNVPRALRIQGDLDVSALAATLRDLVMRHEVFRTRFVAVDGDPFQVIDEEVTPPLEMIDLQTLPAEEREHEVVRLIYERASHLFDLAADHLLKTSLLRLGPQEHVLILVTHHIASDGWSREVLFRELSELYDAHRNGRSARLPDLPIQYADYAAWQRDMLQEEVLQKQLDYWKQQMAGAPALLELPLDHPRPAVQTYNGNTIRRHLLIPSELRDLKALGLEEKATLFMTTLACAKVLLYRHTGQGDLVVGTPIVGRDRPETENLIGYFMNTLVLRTGVSGDMSFREVLREVRRTTLGAFEHQNLPYVKLVMELNPERNPSYNPVFQVLFGFGQGASAPFTLSDLTSTPFAIDRGMAKFDLTISTSEVETGLLGALEYNTDLFTAETISRMMERLENLIKGALANPDAPIAELPLLSVSERKQLLVEWNDTHVDYPPASHLPALFEAQVERTPDAVALEFSGRKLTYAELNARANQVAHYLRQCGVGPDVPVGILMERSAELIVGLLGIHKAGGAYVPLDENYPPERILHILKTAAAPVVITQRVLEANLSGYEGRILCLDREGKQLAEQSEENPASTVGLENLAYVMFTSGSTGQPKGIAVPHSALVHYVRAATDVYGITGADRVLQFASICFDTSIEEIFPCLAVGATLVVRTQEMLDTLSTFWQCTGEWGITVLSLPTAFWHELVGSIAESGPIPETLRLVVIGGEKARADRLGVWQRHVGQRIQLLNTYGPTETTVVATACDITAPTSGEIPIGRPIPNVRTYLLDAFGQPVPRGVLGELYIGGAGVARGYLHDDERTEARFVRDPFVPNERLYRTGDLGRYRPDGNIEFLGRIDNQIKIRGFRIELGEIEAALGAHPAVHEAVVMAREEVPGDTQLLAYVMLEAVSPGIQQNLRTFLSARLPHFMVPARFVCIDAFPRTPGGKVDRLQLRNLPVEAVPEMDDDAEEPIDDVEVRLKALWESVLGRRSVSVCDDFFELGGHSLLAIRLLTEIKREFVTGLSLAEMLRVPTVRAMAQLLRRKERGNESWSSLVPLQPNGDRTPLFCAPVGGGSAFYYRNLAAHIGSDQPLYTFEPIGMSSIHEPHETIEEMAAYYIEQMRAVQPHGPYALCGLSFGGILAYEMARQLRAAGEQVGSLILFDCRAPGYSPVKDRSNPNGPRRALRNLRYKVAFHQENLSVGFTMGDRLSYMRSRTATLQKRVREWAGGKSWQSFRQNPITVELPEVFQKVSKAEARARQNYRPDRYPGRVLLLRARLQPVGYEIEPLLGWERVAEAVDVIETPGTHFSLLDEPCVHVTIAHVRKALEGMRGPR